MYGYNQPSPRWQSCISYTVLMMPHAVGNLFVQEAFDETAEEVVSYILVFEMFVNKNIFFSIYWSNEIQVRLQEFTLICFNFR